MRSGSEGLGQEDENTNEPAGTRGFLQRMETADEDVIGILLAVLVLVVVLQIGSRFILGKPFVWTLELAIVLFVWLIFVGAVVGVRRKSLQAIDILIKLFPPKLRQILALTIHICIIGFVLILIWQGTILAANSTRQVMPTTGLPRAAVFVVVPLSGILMLFYLCRQVIALYAKVEE